MPIGFVVKSPVLTSCSPHDVGGGDGQDGALGEGRVGVLEVEDDGVVALGLDALDGVEFGAAGVVGLRVEDRLVGEDHVAGGEGLAVGEGDALAELEGVGAAVLGDLGELGGEGGLEVELLVVGEEPVEDLGVAVLAVAEERAEAVRFVGDADDCGAGGGALGVGAATGGGAGGGGDGEGRGRREGSGQTYGSAVGPARHAHSTPGRGPF